MDPSKVSEEIPPPPVTNHASPTIPLSPADVLVTVGPGVTIQLPSTDGMNDRVDNVMNLDKM